MAFNQAVIAILREFNTKGKKSTMFQFNYSILIK